MDSTKTVEKRIAVMEEKVADTYKKLDETKIRASEAEGKFREQKNHVDGLSKSIIHLAVKLREAGSYLALMCQKVKVAPQDEAHVILNAKTKIVELEKNSQAKVKDLKAEVDSQI